MSETERREIVIPESDWKWYGMAGHFICSKDCRFHMTTVIEDLMVSTVGLYMPDDRTYETMGWKKGAPIEIGGDRLYETMVFECKPCEEKGCECGGHPIHDTSEVIEFRGYNTQADANAGHMKMCMKVARGEVASE